ncbi:MAG: hypothetical protein Athens041674_213 [Parcubacteria group bacterium Athens0416_74]|nr:MAG: hypothetical protein Athens041674_213 [Parcubacteria group bacterium Athens0416_74]
MTRHRGGYGDYGILAGHYNKGRMPFPLWILEAIRRRAWIDYDIALTLDVGCGTGVATRQLREYGFRRVIGIDTDSRMIAEATRVQSLEEQDTPPIQYYVAAIEDYDLPGGIFDVITTFGGLPWFYDVDGALQNIRRLMNPLGSVFFAADEHPGTLIPDCHDIVEGYIQDRTRLGKRLRMEAPENVLRAHGFSEIRSDRRTETMEVPVEKVVEYILSSSSMNAVPIDSVPRLRKELFARCTAHAVPDNPTIMRGTFDFSFTACHIRI